MDKMKELFKFKPHPIGETGIYIFHSNGREFWSDGEKYSRTVISHIQKSKKIPNKLSLFKEIIHWMRSSWMQNGRTAFVPDRIVVVEAGSYTDISFPPLLFSALKVFLNTIPKKWRRFRRSKRIGGF